MVRIRYKLVLNNAEGRRGPSPTAESNLTGRFEGPMKNDPAAINMSRPVQKFP